MLASCRRAYVWGSGGRIGWTAASGEPTSLMLQGLRDSHLLDPNLLSCLEGDRLAFSAPLGSASLGQVTSAVTYGSSPPRASIDFPALAANCPSIHKYSWLSGAEGKLFLQA